MKGLFDTHCHIDEEAFAADREEVIARQQAEGVAAMVVPGVNVASIETVLDVCHRHPGFCYPALGLHPEDVKENWEADLAIVEATIQTHRNELVAIGEIGLDYYWDKTYKEQQKEVLRRQLRLARELDLPVILHNREATEDILTIVREITNHLTVSPSNGMEKCLYLALRTGETMGNVVSTIDYLDGKGNKINHLSEAPLRGVFHCYSGSKETAEQILKMGFYLGIGGVLTFKNSKLGETLAELNQSPMTNQQSPILERIVLETDAPYMAPVPHRGERNESRWMNHVAEKLAEVLKMPKEAIIAATTANAKQLFGIK